MAQRASLARDHLERLHFEGESGVALENSVPATHTHSPLAAAVRQRTNKNCSFIVKDLRNVTRA